MYVFKGIGREEVEEKAEDNGNDGDIHGDGGDDDDDESEEEREKDGECALSCSLPLLSLPNPWPSATLFVVFIYSDPISRDVGT